MIDQVCEKKRLRRKLTNFLPVLFIVRGSALRVRKPSREVREKKSRNGRQPNSQQQIPPCLGKLTQVSIRNSHHCLTFIFVLANNRPLHHVTGRSQQTFQPFYSMPAARKNRGSIMLPWLGGKNDQRGRSSKIRADHRRNGRLGQSHGAFACSARLSRFRRGAFGGKTRPA